MNFPFANLYRKIRIRVSDKKRISKLQTLITYRKTDAAQQYLFHLLKKTNTDRYLIAYNLTVGYYKTPQTYGAFLGDFINKTGSSCGHGKYNSEYSPVYWLIFIKGKKIEFRFIVNMLCFKGNPFVLELEVEQEGCFHQISEIEYSRLPEDKPNYFRYSLMIEKRNSENSLDFPLLIEKLCKIRIYHCVNNKTRHLILEEAFSKI